MFNREKSHKKQIICLKDEVYEDERNLLVYLFCAKGCTSLPGSLTEKGSSKHTKEMFFSMLFDSPHQANVKHKKYKLWTDIIFERGVGGDWSALWRKTEGLRVREIQGRVEKEMTNEAFELSMNLD